MGDKIKRKFNVNTKELEILKNYKCIIGNRKQIDLYSVSSINNPKNNTIIFSKGDFKSENVKESLIIVNSEFKIPNDSSNIYVLVDNPRLEYAKILKSILDEVDNKNKYIKNGIQYYIGENVEIGEGTIIEPFAFIDDGVVIGNNCYIKSGSKIRKNVVIGNNCILKENCVIGSSGFGLEKDKGGKVFEIPHLGGVVIKDNVEIGALTSIASGTIEPTIIEENVHIDDCVFIAHNCKIGRSSLIIANSEISGSVLIGKECWISPNVSIRQKIKIGNNVTIGMGAVVTKNIDNNKIVAGNPAEDIEIIKKKRVYEKNIIRELTVSNNLKKSNNMIFVKERN